jgi:hypothetical protein
VKEGGAATASRTLEAGEKELDCITGTEVQARPANGGALKDTEAYMQLHRSSRTSTFRRAKTISKILKGRQVG